MNTKGNIGGVGIIIISLAVIITILSFIYVPSIKYTVGGIAFIVGAFYITIYAFQSDFTQSKAFFILLLFGIGIFLFFIPSLGLFEESTISGFSAFSIDNVVVDSQNKIRVTGSALGAEGININLKPEDLNSYLNDVGLSATKTVEGYIQLTKQNVNFNIIKHDEEVLKTITSRSVSGGFTNSSVVSVCNENVPSGFVFNGLAFVNLFGNDLCIYETPQGVLGVFSGAGTLDFQLDVKIGDKRATVTDVDRAVTVGNAQVEFIGNLVSNNLLSAPNYGALYKGSQWQNLVNGDSWAIFLSAQDTLNQCLGLAKGSFTLYGGSIFFPIIISTGVSESKAQSCINSFNDRITQESLLNRNSNYINSLDDIIYDVNQPIFTSSGLTLNLKKPLVYPVITITLTAEDVGIIELKGQPNILNCDDKVDIESGSTKSTVVKIENTAQTSGSFITSVDCKTDINNAFGGTDETLFNRGEIKDIFVKLGGVNLDKDTTKNYSCTITVKDRKSSIQDSCIVKLEVEYVPDRLCAPNTVYCETGTILKTCNAVGIPLYSKCSEACKIVDGTAQCVDFTVSGDGEKSSGDLPGTDDSGLQCKWYETPVIKSTQECKFLNFFCKPAETTTCKTSPTLLIIIFVSAIVIIIIGFFLSFKKPNKKIKKIK